MGNPYSGRPGYTYWRQGVSEASLDDFDPVQTAPFTINKSDNIATCGSCFAQHISRLLMRNGYKYLVTERFEPRPGVVDEGYGVYPARFGNVYTPRQLLQLFGRAYGLYRPTEQHWLGKHGAFVDPFRPRIQSRGFPNLADLESDLSTHLAAVRDMFERADVFIYTMGLTEHWYCKRDGAVLPLAAGVVSNACDPSNYGFGNFTVAELVSDLNKFLELLNEVNPGCKVILTVSPVPLVATYEDRHVLLSTVASKSKLRAAADEVCATSGVAYFPSYELITGPLARYGFYQDDLREVSEAGVEYVMSRFERHYLKDGVESSVAPRATAPRPAPPAEKPTERQASAYKTLTQIVCDEEALVKPDLPSMGGEA